VIGSPSPLFTKITDSQILQYRQRFGGVENKNKGAEFPLHTVIGLITQIQEHNEANHLFVLSVNTGEEKERTIVSALKPHYTIESLMNKRCVVLLNIKQSKIKGINSQGLILTAVKKTVSLLTIDNDSQVSPGTLVLPVSCVLNAEKLIDWKNEQKKLALETIEDGVAAFGGLALQTQQGHAIIAENRVQGAKIQ